MTTIGFIENRIRPLPDPLTDYYITLYSFLNSETAQAIGIQRVAYHKGLGGVGMNYIDEQDYVGDNSIAVFKFNNATVPFYVLIQEAKGWTYGGKSFGSPSPTESEIFGTANLTGTLNGSTFGKTYVPGSPGLYNEFDISATSGYAATKGGVGIAVACFSNGASPWNGTTNNNGTDIKGTPVWKNSVPPGYLCTWPRSNNASGSYDYPASLRHNMYGLVSNEEIRDTHTSLSIIADENNLFIQTDVGNDGDSRFFYFGKYSARPGFTPDVPYVCLYTTGSGANPPFGIRPHRHGNLTGRPEDGGVAHPTASYGTQKCSLEYLRTFVETENLHPNTMFDFHHKFDQFAYFLLLDEDPTQYGYLGRIEFFRLVHGTPYRSNSVNKDYAIFGGKSSNTTKILIPWDNTTPAGHGGSRRGRLF